MSALEAYACGKPIIASKIPSLKDLVEKAGGVLFEPENFKQLGECLFNLLNNDEKALGMGLTGKAFVKDNFSIQSVVDKLETIYEDTISA